jgi:hypothetical protein
MAGKERHRERETDPYSAPSSAGTRGRFPPRERSSFSRLADSERRRGESGPEHCRLQDFGGGVVGSPHEADRAVSVAHILLGEAVVDKDQVPLGVDHHVVRLDVPAKGKGEGGREEEASEKERGGIAHR